MLARFGLPRQQDHTVPKHLHLARLYLPGYLGSKNKGRTGLSVYAPPPERFCRTAAVLGLRVDTEAIFEADAVRTATKEDKRNFKEAEEENIRDTHVGRGEAEGTSAVT